MKYVENSLLPDEHVVYTGKVHWAVLIPGLLILAIGAILLGAMQAVPVLNHPALRMFILLGGGSFVLWGALHTLGAVVKRATTELALTNKRIISRSGFIQRRTLELWYAKIESVAVDQSPLGRIFGYGSLRINGVGGHRAAVYDIEQPQAFHMKAMEIIDNVQVPQQQSK